MLDQVFKSRRVYFLVLLLFFFSGCARNSWHYSSLDFAEPSFFSSKIACSSSNDPYVEFEIVRSETATQAWINFLTYKAQPLEDHPDLTPATLSIDDHIETFSASKLKGSQRILIPQEQTAKILTLLEAGKTVQMTLSGIEISLDPKGFKKAYKKLTAPLPKISLPSFGIDWS